MAVYTEVSFDEAASFVARLDIGALLTIEACAGGIENTNYFVDTSTGRYVLTLFERLGFEQLPFYLRLMKHLAERGLPVPRPRADAGGAILHSLKGKPAALVDRLRGAHLDAPDAAHCASVGTLLARLHQGATDFELHQPNLRGLAWWVETVPLLREHLAAAQLDLIDTELAFQQQLATSAAYAGLPRGPIHADLFRDNVMFHGDELTGAFDFYFAGVDTFLFDIAVCLNDWCVDPDTACLAEERAVAFVDAYHAQRALTHNELRLMPALMRAAALRFWISRLWDWHLPRDAQLLSPKDPGHFERVLRERLATPWHPVM